MNIDTLNGIIISLMVGLFLILAYWIGSGNLLKEIRTYGCDAVMASHPERP